MGKITIIDTGYPTSDRDGNPNSGTDINDFDTYRCRGTDGNSGSPITLSCGPIRRRSGVVLADDPNPGSGKVADTHSNTFNNAVYELDHIVNCKDTTEAALLKEILALERTKGVKLLYNSDTNDITKTLPELIGRVDTKFNITDPSNNGSSLTLGGIPLIVCKVIGSQVNNIPTSIKFAINVTLTLEETKVVPRT